MEKSAIEMATCSILKDSHEISDEETDSDDWQQSFECVWNEDDNDSCSNSENNIGDSEDYKLIIVTPNDIPKQYLAEPSHSKNDTKTACTKIELVSNNVNLVVEDNSTENNTKETILEEQNTFWKESNIVTINDNSINTTQEVILDEQIVNLKAPLDVKVNKTNNIKKKTEKKINKVNVTLLSMKLLSKKDSHTAKSVKRACNRTINKNGRIHRRPSTLKQNSVQNVKIVNIQKPKVWEKVSIDDLDEFQNINSKEDKFLFCISCNTPSTEVCAKKSHKCHVIKNKKIHDCEKCFAKEYMISFVETETYQNIWQYVICSRCGRIVFRSDDDNHYVNKFKKPIYCRICFKLLDNEFNLKQHLKEHELLVSLRCYKCAMICETTSELREHTKKCKKPRRGNLRKKKNSSVYCKFCDKKFDNRIHLEAHIKTHSDNKPFSCPICQCFFDRYINLKEHLKQRPCMM